MPEAPLKLDVEFVYSTIINFSMQQNHVPVVRKLTVENNTGKDFENLLVEIHAEPGFALPWIQQITSLRSGESFDFSPVNLNVSSQYLADLTERESGRFILLIKAGEEILYQQNYDVDLLAFDQWNGINLLPEMLASFITPNHPEIPKVIKRASVILQSWTGDPSFNEYQSRNPDRVKKQMAALYEAIAGMQIVYCSVSASFEETGQRIRLSDSIFLHKIANCLDISLLYASCLEAVGIHPLIVIVKGHAFAGAWLIDDSFSDAVNDDPSLLTKRAADGINEIALVEATCMNAGNTASFDDAVKSADEKMTHVDDFILFLDINRIRFSRIRPLPLRIATTNGWKIVEETLADRDHVTPELIEAGIRLTDVQKIDVSRQQLWERKLLDLSLRNNLLNVRITKSTIPFISTNLNSLEDALADGQEFQLLSKPSDWENPMRDSGLYQSMHLSDPIKDLVKDELKQKRIRTCLSEKELTEGLTNLYRSSRVSIEENGANTLYLALGLLKWYEANGSERPHFAPILLLPVDIIKKSAQKGFVIKSREEETMVNITLLEMLRHDFGITIGGLETLPKDESGVDVKTIFNIIRQSVMSQSRWDVEENALLATFSFSKFILWNDIHNNAENLCKNKVVASLVSGKLEWQPDINDPTFGKNLDEDFLPTDIALPLSCDSSQLEAIISSGLGRSFVLHGPPGTGKSQTITNIIANALYAGKRVLFVAAKKAALDVVETRLKAIGLTDFCLELHSNKAKKSVILEQLKKTMEIVKTVAPENFQAEADRLFILRNELNGYVQALHKKYAFGYSLFDLYCNYGKVESLSDKVQFGHSAFDDLTEKKVSVWNDLVEEMQAVSGICGHPFHHPLEAINVKQYSLPLKLEAVKRLNDYVDTLGKLQVSIEKNRNILKLMNPVKNQEQVISLHTLCDRMINLPDIPETLFALDSVEQTLAQVIGIAAHGIKRDELKEKLLVSFNKGILSFPAEHSLFEWNIANSKWLLPKWLKQNTIVKLIRPYSKDGRLEKEGIPIFLQAIMDYQEEQAVLDQALFLPGLLGFLWKEGSCDWSKLMNSCNIIIQINRAALKLNGIEQLKQWRKDLAQQFSEGSMTFILAYKETMENCKKLYEACKDQEIHLQHLLGIDFDKLPGWKDNYITYSISGANNWLSHIELLKDWSNWITIKEKALAAGLQPLLLIYENGGIECNELIKQYKKGFYRSAAEYIIANSPVLASFNGKLFGEKIRKFKDISKQFEQLTKDELYARLASRIPVLTMEASQSSEIGILQHAIGNKGRAMSIRKLFDLIPNLLPRLSSCMLMSPISVAQYFDADSPKFDLVIFDEASQLPTCEAVGAIARANNAIIVGDPKQMPPTAFFSINNIDEDNIDKEDLESILDDCLALSMPSKFLLWHYRSKHESLIAFSNAKYYNNKLFTFPSTDDITTKVNFVPIDGYYDKGKTKQNPFEAKAIVDEIVYRLSDPELSKKSIGVVTFSIVQQILIDDLLNDVFKARPDIEKMALESEEPLFIKNLENVQGDERDVILFSVGYGPDKEGKVSLNFGPINREGGWRRLNVAITRARYEMKVFSTLHSNQIDITRTTSEGVAGLKDFLAYAEKGKSALPNRSILKEGKAGAFEKIIAQEISKYGYQVHTNIGGSGFKIDLGIVDPQNSSQYILGIICDGKNYYTAKTSHDREILQTNVLSLLGWNIYKLWSTDWWENPEMIINEIVSAIKKVEENRQTNSKPAQPEVLPTSSLKEEKITDNVVLNHSYIAPIYSTPPVIMEASTPYEVAILEVILDNTPDNFFREENQQKIKQQILDTLKVESPLSKNLLCSRVLSAWGITRMGTRVSAFLEQLFLQLKIMQITYGRNTFLWKEGHDPLGYDIYRKAQNETQKRVADDLPPEEVANCVRYILMNQISLPLNDLVKETARLFDFGHIGSKVETAMLLGIKAAVSKGYATEEQGRIVFKS